MEPDQDEVGTIAEKRKLGSLLNGKKDLDPRLPHTTTAHDSCSQTRGVGKTTHLKLKKGE